MRAMIYAYTYIYIYIHIYIYKYTYIYIHICIYNLIPSFLYRIPIYAYTNIRTHTQCAYTVAVAPSQHI
jgi:hypothetical protein